MFNFQIPAIKNSVGKTTELITTIILIDVFSKSFSSFILILTDTFCYRPFLAELTSFFSNKKPVHSLKNVSNFTPFIHLFFYWNIMKLNHSIDKNRGYQASITTIHPLATLLNNIWQKIKQPLEPQLFVSIKNCPIHYKIFLIIRKNKLLLFFCKKKELIYWKRFPKVVWCIHKEGGSKSVVLKNFSKYEEW